MIGRLKHIVRGHPIITYVLAVLSIIGEACCMAYLIDTNSDKTLWLGFPCIFTAWLIAVLEQIRTSKTIKRDAYLRITRRINRYNW